MALSDSSSQWTDDDDFDFNAWIEANELTAVKSIFIKHNMFSLPILSMQSSQFPSFIANISAQNATYVHKIVQALQTLNSKTTTNMNSNTNSIHIKKIRASDEEFAVEELIETKKKEFNQLKNDIQHLYDKYMQENSLKSEKMQTIQTQIDMKFTDILSEIEQQKKNISSEIREFGENFAQKIATLKNLLSQIESETQFVAKQWYDVGKLLDNEHIERETRRRSILEIGDQIKKRYELNYKKYQHSFTDLKMKNDAIYINDHSYNKVIKYLKKFGKLKCGNLSSVAMDDMIEYGQETKWDDFEGRNKKNTPDINKLNEMISNKENEHKKEKELLKLDLLSQKHQIGVVNERCDRLIVEKKDLNEKYLGLMIEEGKHAKINKKLHAKYDLLKKREIGVQADVNEKEAEIEQLVKDKCYLQRQIEKLEHETQELNDNLSLNEGSNWKEEIENCLLENDRLKNEIKTDRKTYSHQISDLQRKIKAVNSINNIKEIEFNKLKANMHKNSELQKKIKALHSMNNMKESQINQMRANMHKNNNNNYKKMNTNNRKVAVDNNINKRYVMMVKNQQSNSIKNILSKITAFDGKNGKQFVEAFCKMAKYGKPKYEITYVKQVWLCRIEIIQMKLKQEYTAKQKKAASNQCYQQLAARINKICT